MPLHGYVRWMTPLKILELNLWCLHYWCYQVVSLSRQWQGCSSHYEYFVWKANY